MPSTHLPPSSSAGLVVHWAERNDNVSSSQGPSRSRQEEILMENKVWNVDTNLADPQQCFTFTSATRCQGFNYLFSPLRYMDVFREFQVMREAESQCLSGLGKFVLSWLGWLISPISLCCQAPSPLSVLHTEYKWRETLFRPCQPAHTLGYIGWKWKVRNTLVFLV